MNNTDPTACVGSFHLHCRRPAFLASGSTPRLRPVWAFGHIRCTAASLRQSIRPRRLAGCTLPCFCQP